jgi:hypothetical protein
MFFPLVIISKHFKRKMWQKPDLEVAVAF